MYSQNDEDGILEEIFRRIGTASRSFVEFGVTDGRENNTLKLLLEGWHGLWIEAGAAYCQKIRRTFGEQIDAGALELVQSMVTAENIDALVAGARAARAGELDLLSIDIDGNDYHVLAARLGYRLVATNVTGSNAFFVRSDLAGDRFFTPATAMALYNPPRYWLTWGFVVGHRPTERPYRYTSDAALAGDGERRSGD